MFCSNCGHKLNGTEDFCSNCGKKIVFNINNNGNVDDNFNNETEILDEQTKSEVKSTFTEQLANNSAKLRDNITNKIKIFFSKYKNQMKYTIIGVLVVGICIFLYSIFIGFEMLSWDKSYSDLKLDYVTQTIVNLGINFSNKDKLKEINISSNCGKVTRTGVKIKWNLSNATGSCKIEVKHKLKKIAKKYKIISYKHEQNFSLEYEIDNNAEVDLDYDNLTNKQESEYKTNPELADTDMDGLNDDEELFNTKTDPNKKDTDNDGLTDFDEIKLQLNPLKVDSKGDGIKDGDRSFTYTYEKENIKLVVTGKGNIASTTAEINSDTKISKKQGLIDKLYSFYTKGKIEEADVSISYANADLTNLNEDNLTIFYYNEKTSKYEKIDTTLDKENKILTAKLKHFSSYVIGDETLVQEKSKTQILFILDNSWSLYTNEQYEKYTGKKYVGEPLDAFDKNGIRFTLTSNLVSRLAQKSYEIGLSEFRYDYTNAFSIGVNYSGIKKSLNNMNGKFITNIEGTNIANALTNGIKEFSEDSDNKYIVILTDGLDTTLAARTNRVVENANSNNVKICSIGFGSAAYSVDLSNISNSTGCKFFSSNNAEGLAELFENIGAELDDNLVDIDEDNKVDGYLVADSGFVVNKNGFSFANYGSNLSDRGHCYGMATFAELYYKRVLPLKVDGSSRKAFSYNLDNSNFTDYNNLFSYKLKTNALKHSIAIGYEYFKENTPADYYYKDEKDLLYSDKYKKEIMNLQFYDIKKEKSLLSAEEQIKKWGVEYKYVENALLNEDKMQNSPIIDNTDKNLFNAIYYSFVKQNYDAKYSSAMNSTLWIRDKIGSEKIVGNSEAAFINILKTRLNDQDPVVISSSFNGGLHAINAISLVQDIENPNYYYIGVYDNNYPGEKRYVDLECIKDKCVTRANSYYSGDNQAIRLTTSLEEDLSYYGG